MSTHPVVGPPSTRALARGLYRLARLVALTYGPAGGTVAVRKADGSIVLTSDGASLVREAAGRGPQGLGMALGRIAACGAEGTAGDGTSTALLLTEALVRGTLRRTGGVPDPSWVLALREAAKKAQRKLREVALPATRDRVERIAHLASHGEALVAEKVVAAVDRVGEGGTVLLQPGEGVGVELDHREGMVLEQGWAGPHAGPADGAETYRLEGPLVAVVAHPLTEAADIRPLLEEASQWPGRGVVVFAPWIWGTALATMLVNDRARVLSSTAVSYSGSPLELRDWLHDLAALTGATVVDRVAGMEPAQFRAEWLGSARKIQVSASQTVLWGYPEADARLDARIAELNGRAERTPHDHERDRLRARAANLDGGLCTLKIGGYTSPQAQERRARAEDTLHAVRTCLSTGVVPGAGAAYAWVAHHLDTSPGEDLLAEALRTPRDVLARRAGVAPAVVRTQDSAHYAEDPTGWTGWDPVERRWRRLDQGAAVLDSAGVVEAALESAVSVASTLLSTGALLTRSR